MNRGRVQRNNHLLKAVQEKEGPCQELQKTKYLE
jgi:hypothetical protein